MESGLFSVLELKKKKKKKKKKENKNSSNYKSYFVSDLPKYNSLNCRWTDSKSGK
ncbi:hypothetical protein VTK26DRAFT_2734 [Humicola hyalothermophila]